MMFVPYLSSSYLLSLEFCSLLHYQRFGVHIPLIPEEWPDKEAADQAVIRTWGGWT